MARKTSRIDFKLRRPSTSEQTFRRGLIIVELLIVIVVIVILAELLEVWAGHDDILPVSATRH